MKDVLQKSAEMYEPRGHLDPAGFKRHVSFRTYQPPVDLAPFIEHFWIIRWDKVDKDYNSEQVMQRPYVDVFFSLPWSGIQGTFSGKRIYTATTGSGRIIGIRFRPGAFHAFWSDAMAELQGVIVAVERVFPEVNNQYVEQLLTLDDERAVRQLTELVRAKNPQRDDAIKLINDIIAAVEDDDSLRTVSLVAKRFARSERWLQQLFADYVGIGLKWLLQRHKLLAAAEQIRKIDNPQWSAIAYDLGYSSQQHFITDFKKVLGKTPLQYKKELDAG